MGRMRRRWWMWAIGALLAIVLAVVAFVAVPILTHRDQGLANQAPAAEEWPVEASATGDDGRLRTISVTVGDGREPDLSQLSMGAQLIVSGSGYDPERGIYVAVCAIPDDPSVKPGPCLGGSPTGSQVEVEEGTIQYGPSNWINDDWAWKLFGARSYDDRVAGTFTAYLEIPAAADDHVDCTAVACAIYTRNDHTASNDRVQDLFLPIAFL